MRRPTWERSQGKEVQLQAAKATRDWRIHADCAQRLICIARKLDANAPFGVDLTNTADALDSTTIDHTLLELRGNRYKDPETGKRLTLSRSFYEILQILSLNLFEQLPLNAALALTSSACDPPSEGNQRILFD